MKSLLLLLAAAVLAPLLILAQAPSPGPVPAAPSPSPAPAGNPNAAAAGVPLPGQSPGPALEKTLPLIPETAPPSHHAHPGRSRPGTTPHDVGTFQVEQDIRVRIRLREAETRAFNEPAIRAEWDAAHRTRTDPERRALLTIFYNDLYHRMMKLDPSIAQHADNRRQAALMRMKYTRLGDLDNSEDPFVHPPPDPSGPNPPLPDSESSTPQ